mgnify:CR=1 FL=1
MVGVGKFEQQNKEKSCCIQASPDAGNDPVEPRFPRHERDTTEPYLITPLERYLQIVLLAQSLVVTYSRFTFDARFGNDGTHLSKKMEQLLDQIQKYYWSRMSKDEQNQILDQLHEIQDFKESCMTDSESGSSSSSKTRTSQRAEYTFSDLVFAAQNIYGEELYELVQQRVTQKIHRYRKDVNQLDVTSLIIDEIKAFCDSDYSDKEIIALMRNININEVVGLYYLSNEFRRIVELRNKQDEIKRTKKNAEMYRELIQQYFSLLFGKDGFRFGVKSTVDAINLALKYLVEMGKRFGKNFTLQRRFALVMALAFIAGALSGCTPADTDAQTLFTLEKPDGEHISLAQACGDIFRAFSDISDVQDPELAEMCMKTTFEVLNPSIGGLYSNGVPEGMPVPPELQFQPNVVLDKTDPHLSYLIHELLHWHNLTKKIGFDFVFEDEFQMDVEGVMQDAYLLYGINERSLDIDSIEYKIDIVKQISFPNDNNLSGPLGGLLVVQWVDSSGNAQIMFADISALEETITDFSTVILGIVINSDYEPDKIRSISDEEIIDSLQESGYFSMSNFGYSGDIQQELIAGYVRFMLNDIANKIEHGPGEPSYLGDLLKTEGYYEGVFKFIEHLAKYSGGFNKLFLEIIQEMTESPQYYAIDASKYYQIPTAQRIFAIKTNENGIMDIISILQGFMRNYLLQKFDQLYTGK